MCLTLKFSDLYATFFFIYTMSNQQTREFQHEYISKAGLPNPTDPQHKVLLTGVSTKAHPKAGSTISNLSMECIYIGPLHHMESFWMTEECHHLITSCCVFQVLNLLTWRLWNSNNWLNTIKKMNYMVHQNVVSTWNLRTNTYKIPNFCQKKVKNAIQIYVDRSNLKHNDTITFSSSFWSQNGYKQVFFR